MKKKLATISAVAVLIMGMVFSGAAQTLEGTNSISSSDKDNLTSESSDITVGVTSTAAIDVKPTSLSFPNMDVGTQETIADGPQDKNTFGSVSIENIGSEYIDRVWAGATSLSDDPFGTGLPSEYNAGNFLQIKPANSTDKASVRGNTSTYHFVNRYEFANSWDDNKSDIPSYIEASPSAVLSSATAEDTYVGRLRAGNQWYFYAIVTDTTTDICDGTGGSELRVGNTPHSSSQFGTVDFTAGGPEDWTAYDIVSTDGSYGLTGTTVKLDWNNGDIFRKYDILTACDDTNFPEGDPHTIRTRYNVQAGDVSDLTASGGTGDNASQTTQFLLDATSPEDMLLPGEALTIDTAVEVPQGVPEGSVSSGSITFYVTSDYDAQK